VAGQIGHSPTTTPAPFTGRRARACRQPRPLHHLQSKNRAKKSPSGVLAFFLRGFSPSGGSWSRPPSLPGHRSPSPRAPYSSTPGKPRPELKHSPFAANNGATIIIRGFFSLLGCPWSCAARAACPASGAAVSWVLGPGFGVLQCVGIWGLCFLAYLTRCPA
jgi:hypothetical protein